MTSHERLKGSLLASLKRVQESQRNRSGERYVGGHDEVNLIVVSSAVVASMYYPYADDSPVAGPIKRTIIRPDTGFNLESGDIH